MFQYDFIYKKTLKLLIEDVSQVWINLHDLFYTLRKTPSKFIWGSERTGFMHIELRDYNTGNLIKPLTQGNWVVQRIIDIDETNSLIYFLANRETPLEIHLYRVNYNDEIPKVERITQEPGCHNVYCFNQTYQYCITQWSSIDQYPLIRMLDVQKKEIVNTFDHLQQGRSQIIAQFNFVKPKLFSILNRNNDTLYCALYQPDNEQQRFQTPYPTLVSVYGGPHLQRYKNELHLMNYSIDFYIFFFFSVTNAWSLRSDMRCQRFVEAGYAVLCLDNRGSSNRGVAFESPIKHDMGRVELEDQIDGVNYLIQQGITDETRVGIYGWSYGGYMSAMALVRASHIFKLAIAGAPVTHWDG